MFRKAKKMLRLGTKNLVVLSECRCFVRHESKDDLTNLSVPRSA